MGYESRIYIMDEFKSGNDVHAIELATINMSGMETSFMDLFKTPIEYKIFADDPNEDTDTDCYGAKIKSADIDTVLNWLDNEINVKKVDYRRLKPLYYLLKAYKEDEDKWDTIKVLHYGY